MENLKSINGSLFTAKFSFFGFIMKRDTETFNEALSYLLHWEQPKLHQFNHIENAAGSLSYSVAELDRDAFWFTPITSKRFDDFARIVYKFYSNLNSDNFEFNAKIKIEHNPTLWALVERGKIVSGQTILEFPKTRK